MNLVRLDPWSDFANMHREMDRLFGAPPVTRRLAEVYRPEADVEEDKDHVRLHLDLPGVDRESIDVQLTGDTLTISAERKHLKVEGVSALHRERRFGTFQRTFTLGVPVKQDKVDATYRDGVLTIALPKIEEVKPHKISVKAVNGG